MRADQNRPYNPQMGPDAVASHLGCETVTPKPEQRPAPLRADDAKRLAHDNNSNLTS
jgi:hypothetical protein